MQITIENYLSSSEVDPEINDRKILIIRSLLEHGADAKAIDPQTKKSLLQITIESYSSSSEVDPGITKKRFEIISSLLRQWS